MKRQKQATSIVEAMIIILIVTLWITWVYKVYSESMKLSKSVELKIQAISMWKEAIEIMTNIRDTNWILFSNNTSSCWNTLNYNSLCLTWAGNQIAHSWSYIITQDPQNRWLLESNPSITTFNYTDSDYRDYYRMRRDANGFYSQSWTLVNTDIFTREILTHYIDTNWDSIWDTTDEKMEITAIVHWKDTSSDTPRQIVLKKILTNWKK